jgi:GNAT superfamily N-acetyltransferase
MVVRQVNISDLDALAKLFDAYRVFYDKKSDVAAAKVFLAARIENKESVIFAAFSGEEMVGFTQLYPLFSSTRMKRLWLLNDLFVDHLHRGKGFSVALIDAAKAHARATDACGLMLETAKTNIIGNALYPRTGFILEEDFNFYHWTS